MNSLKWSVITLGCLFLLTVGCAADKSKRNVAGPYQTWDDVINRWIGAKTDALYYEMGPPNLHPHELDNGMTEMVWDMTIDRMPGNADEYHLWPLYGGTHGGVNCMLVFVADTESIVRSGRRIGCD